MSFLSGLSNIFHSIGHVLSGGDDNQDQKKKQQQQQPVVVQPTQNQPQNNVFTQFQANNPQQNPLYSPNLNLTPLQKQLQTQHVGSYDPNAPLVKKANAEAAQPQAPEDKNSTGYKLTHNAVTNFLGGIVKPTAEFGHAVIETPHAIYREIQNKPINDIQQNVFGTTDQGKILKKIVGDTVNTGLLVAAPGVDSLAETGVKAAAGDAAEQIAKQTALHAAGVPADVAAKMAAQDVAAGASNLVKIAPKVISGAVIGGGSGAASTYSEGGSAKQVLTSAGENALIGGATAGIFAGIPVLAKAVKNGIISPQEADNASKIAPGVHSVNAERYAALDAATDRPPTTNQPGQPAPAGGEAAPGIAPELQNADHGIKKSATKGTPKVVNDAVPAPGNIEPVKPIDPATVPPVQQPLVPEAVTKAPGAEEPPVQAEAKPTTKVQAPNAPGIRKAAQKKLDSLAGNAGDPTMHDVLSNQELLDAGKAHADTFNDRQLVNQFKNGFQPADAADVAKGHAALERLNAIAKANPDDKDAAKAIDNILAGAEQGFSKGGRTVNYAQQFYDGLQGPAKTNYLIRQIEKVRDAADMPQLTDSERAAATEKVQAHVNAEEANKANIARLETRLEEIKQEAQNGNGSKELTKEANDLNRAIKQHQLAMSKNTAELGKFYDNIAPIKQATQAKVGDLGRSLMLSSIAGRGNDIVTTGINSTHQLLQNTIEAAAGKLVKNGSGKVISTLPSPTAIARGMKFGVQKSVQRFKGNVAAGEASALLKKVDNGSGKGQLLSKTDGSVLSKVVAPVHRVVRSATEIATDLSEGVKESRIQQLASKEGKSLGLKGDDLKSYTAATTASPSKAMVEVGNRLRDEVNNMQDNKLSDALDSIAKGIGKVPVVGEQLRNMTLPFTRWTGGAIHNAVMDKNVVANTAQLIKAATRGDQQGMITAVSKLAVNGVASIGAGYTLAKAGLLTHENAQGYNDDGVYLHVHGRYIPAGFLGFFAPGLIMGSAAHDAMSKTDPNGKHVSVLDQTLSTVKDTFINSEKALGAESLTGESNPVIQALQQANKNGYGDVGAVAGGQVVGQYIPAVTGDVNAVLNQTPLNPTHEAALTKVEKGANGTLTKEGKPSTAKDVPRTVVNQLLNKVPFASQALPRNPGVGANDEFDRLTRGDHDTKAELKAKADAKTAQEISADYAKRGVPDPNGQYKTGDSFDQAVENRIENKKYDQAIEGLQAQLKKVESGPDVTSKKTDPIKKQISIAQVLKDGNFEPTIRDEYDGKNTGVTLAEWRKMGDPTSDTYDKDKYEELWAYDKALADKGAGAGKNGTQKYSLKDTSKSTAASARRAAAAAQSKITSNKLGNTPNLPTIDLSSIFSPQKISTTAKIPTIQQVQPGELIKKRAISVSKARG